MQQLPLVPILAALLVGAILIIAFLWYRYESLLAEHERQIKESSRRSVDQSRSTLKGQIAEQMAPLLPGFAYSPADARFIGEPVDYVVFDGRTEIVDGGGEVEELEIVLLEIKQGQSKMKPVQQAIARAVEEGRVRFEVSRIAEDGSIETNVWRGRKR
jgi:predicted Holliday junction resolvase-like endonuclease